MFEEFLGNFSNIFSMERNSTFYGDMDGCGDGDGDLDGNGYGYDVTRNGNGRSLSFNMIENYV